MGMVAKFHQISEGQLSQFLRHPSLAYDYTMSSLYDDPLAIEKAEDMLSKMRSQIARFSPSALRQVDNVAALLRRKTAARKGPRLVTSAYEPESERKEFSLEKDWHVLHYSI